MKKTLLYLFSIMCLAVFILSESKPFMESWSDFRIPHLPFTRARYGDLYSCCFLSGFMDTTKGEKLKEYRTSKKNIDLYVLHDSYLDGQIKKENFVGVDTLILSNAAGSGVCVNLNRNKKNILIIECAERAADWRLTITDFVYPKVYSKKTKPGVKIKRESPKNISILFNPMINQNIEFNLFDYELFRPIKEIKAEINYKYFNKIPKDIAVSSDKNYLLLNETVDNRFPESSFLWLSDEYIGYIVSRINEINRHYKKMGFDKVYISIIPNPVSILDPERMVYNQKMERILKNYKLDAGAIDVYDAFRRSKKQLYRRDDSHWNGNGLQLWVDEVNKIFLSF